MAKMKIRVEIFTNTHDPQMATKDQHPDIISVQGLLKKIPPKDLIDFKVTPDYSGQFIVTVIWKEKEKQNG